MFEKCCLHMTTCLLCNTRRELYVKLSKTDVQWFPQGRNQEIYPRSLCTPRDISMYRPPKQSEGNDVILYNEIEPITDGTHTSTKSNLSTFICLHTENQGRMVFERISYTVKATQRCLISFLCITFGRALDVKKNMHISNIPSTSSLNTLRA